MYIVIQNINNTYRKLSLCLFHNTSTVFLHHILIYASGRSSKDNITDEMWYDHDVVLTQCQAPAEGHCSACSSLT